MASFNSQLASDDARVNFSSDLEPFLLNWARSLLKEPERDCEPFPMSDVSFEVVPTVYFFEALDLLLLSSKSL